MSILEMGVSGGAMILVTAVLRLIAGDRLPRRAYIAMWSAAILRLLVPVRITSALSVYGLVPPALRGVQGLGTAPAGSSETVGIRTVLRLAGTLAAAVVFAASYIRCIRAFRVSVPAENMYVKRWLKAHPLWRSVEVRVISGLKTPLTYGLFRPVILLPRDAEDWEPEKLGMVLCHEYIHIRRFDGALKLLAVAALCVHWWNPAVWLMAALLDRDVELACDGEVVDRFGPECRARYAGLLIDLKAPGGTVPPVTGFGKSVTEKRIRGVMGHRRAARSAAAISAAIAAATVLLFATSSNPRAEKAPEQGGKSPELTVENLKPGALENIPAHLPEKRGEDTEPAIPEHPLYREPAGPAGETYETYVIRPEWEQSRAVDASGGEKSD